MPMRMNGRARWRGVERRVFIATAAAAAGRALAAPGPAGTEMRLSLSVRVAEAFESKEKTTMTLDALIALARANRFRALCMRASQAGIQTPRAAVAEMARKIRQAGLAVSMVTGDFAVPSNNERGPEGLRRITPYLDLAEAFGADLIRIAMRW